MFVIIPTLPTVITSNGTTTCFVKSYGLYTVLGSGRYDDGIFSKPRILHNPLQGLHSAHTSTNHRMQSSYPQMINQRTLCMNHVSDRKIREGRSVSFPTPICSHTRRPSGSPAPTKTIRRNYKETICINWLSWPHNMVPPTRLIVFFTVNSCNMMVAC